MTTLDPQCGWRARLTAVSADLRAYMTASEGVFLATGAELAELDRRARLLLERARAAHLDRAAERGGDPASRLGEALAGLERYLGQVRDTVTSHAEGMPRLVAEAEEILARRADLETIGPTLRMLGMNTRVENAREAQRTAGMEAVADEVRRLAEVADGRFRELFAHAGELREVAESAGALARGFLAGQVLWSEQMLSESRAALAGLREVADADQGLAARAVAAVDRLSGALSEMLVALQGHDAARQILEHADEALRTAADDDAARAALCAVQAAQLRGAHERLVAVLEGLARGLLTAVLEVAEVSDRPAAHAGGDASPLERVVRGVREASASFQQHVEHQDRTEQALARVAGAVGRMAGYLRDLQGVSAEVKLIALNALVQTTRAGDRGRVLAVLATAMGDLSGQVIQHTGGVAAGLSRIGQAADALGRSGAGARGEAGRTLAGALGGLGGDLAAYHAGLVEAEGRLRDDTSALQRQVISMMERLTAAETEAGALLALAAALDEVGAEAAGRSPTGAAASGPDEASAFARYTMEAERAVHRTALHAPPLPAPRPLRAPDPTGLGANVELF